MFSEAPVPQPARPSAMNQQWKSHIRRARGSTTAAFPQRGPYRHTQYPCMIVQRALRANYVIPRFLMTPAQGWPAARRPRAAFLTKCGADLSPRPLLGRRGGLLGLSARGAPSGFTVGRLAIARGDQFFLKLQPFIGCHDGLFARRRQIFYREINACFRRRRCLSPRVH